MRRRLFNILAVLSLLFLVATVALWVRSYFVVDVLTRSSRQVGAGRVVWRDDQWLCQKGVVEWSHELNWDADLKQAAKDPPQPLMWTSDSLDNVYVYTTGVSQFYRRWSRLGFSWSRNVGRSKDRFTGIPLGFRSFAIGAPFWALAMATAILPALFIKKCVFRRPSHGHCACGYNLTGNVSGVCPECGNKVATETQN